MIPVKLIMGWELGFVKIRYKVDGVPPKLSGFVYAFHLPPQVRVPSTPSTLISICTFQIVYLSLGLECEKDENKQKEAATGPFV